MSIESIDPAQNHYNELVAGLIARALEGQRLADAIFVLQREHEANILAQIALSGEINAFLEGECWDPGHREYLKGQLAERIREVAHPKQRAAGAEPLPEPPQLHIVTTEDYERRA